MTETGHAIAAELRSWECCFLLAALDESYSAFKSYHMPWVMNAPLPILTLVILLLFSSWPSRKFHLYQFSRTLRFLYEVYIVTSFSVFPSSPSNVQVSSPPSLCNTLYFVQCSPTSFYLNSHRIRCFSQHPTPFYNMDSKFL